MDRNNTWSRRNFSKAVLSLQALVASGALNIPFGCSTKENAGKSVMLSPSMEKLLQLAMDELIPGSDSMPAASEAGGMQYIFNVLEEHPGLQEGFGQILRALDEQSNKFKKSGFGNLDRDSRISVLLQFEKEQPGMFSVLRDFVYESYYINEKVWKLIGYEPFTTLSAGPEMEPFDEKLLERVRQMPALYKNV